MHTELKDFPSRWQMISENGQRQEEKRKKGNMCRLMIYQIIRHFENNVSVTNFGKFLPNSQVPHKDHTAT